MTTTLLIIAFATFFGIGANAVIEKSKPDTVLMCEKLDDTKTVCDYVIKDSIEK